MKTNRRKMSWVQLTFITAANMLGAGIIMLPAQLAEVGTISIFSWIITSLGSLTLAMVFARCGMFTTKPGGMGGYAEYGYGRIGHFMANYAYSVSIVIANVAIAISAVGYGAGFLGSEFSPVQTWIYTVALLWLAASLNLRGTRYSGKFTTVTIWGSILPILVMSTLGWYWFDPSTWIAAWCPNPLGWSDAVGSSISLTFSAWNRRPSIWMPLKTRRLPCRKRPFSAQPEWLSFTLYRQTSLPALSRMRIS